MAPDSAADADAATPVIIGVGRVTQKRRGSAAAEIDEALDPVGLMAAAARRAAADATEGAAGGLLEVLLSRIDCVSTVMMMLEERIPKERRPLFKNPPLGVARALGARGDARCLMSQHGGQAPQVLVRDAAERLAAGEVRLVVVAGGECLDTFMRAVKAGRTLPGVAEVRDAVGRRYEGSGGLLRWGDDAANPEPELVGKAMRVSSRQEAMHGLAAPSTVYALLDQALRHHLGRSAEEHLRRNAEVFAGISRVSASEANLGLSWLPAARNPGELANVTAENRAVTLPGYPKYLNAIQDVDQAGALLMTTVGQARELGVPEGRWVYIHGIVEAEEAPAFITERPELHRSRALAAVGAELRKAARRPLESCEHVEVYSCFPVAVEVACRELGLAEAAAAEDGARLTVLGGLPYHGGPGNSYALLGVAAMCDKLRADPGSFGLVTANGGWLTKHSVAVYSTTPDRSAHPGGGRWQPCPGGLEELQRALAEDSGRLELAANPNGQGVVETCTVEHGREGPTRAVFVGRLTDGAAAGRRFVATSRAEGAVALVLAGRGIGAEGRVSTEGGRSTFEPARSTNAAESRAKL